MSRTRSLMFSVARFEASRKWFKIGKLKSVSIAALALVLAGAGAHAQGQQRMSDEELERLVERLETNTDRFEDAMDDALDRSRIDGSMREDDVLALVDEFEKETNQLRDRIDDNEVIRSDVNVVLSRALRIQMLLDRNPNVARSVQPTWTAVKQDLDRLAQVYNAAPVLTTGRAAYLKNIPVKQVVNRIEERADDFAETLDDVLDDSPLDGSPLEDEITQLAKDFEKEADQLSDRADNRPGGGIVAADVQALLNRALAIERFMRANRISPRAERDWSQVKANLDELAEAYNLAPVYRVTVTTTTTRPIR